jgi:uncharacterized repeat protein (TIGR04076 family)
VRVDFERERRWWDAKASKEWRNSEMSKGKITVLKRMVDQDLIDRYRHKTVVPCDRLDDGQVFVVDDWDVPPEGFCEWAWADLQAKIALAGRIGMAVACCTDAFRPVVFEIQRQE